MKHTVCAVTGSRAEFGLLRPLLEKLNREEEMDFHLVVTGSHLSDAFGNTQSEIESSGLPVHARIPIPLTGDSKADMVRATGAALASFAAYFAANRPELVVILGDRYEIFAVASAAAMLGIPIVHLYGGETTEGAVDEFLRHSITKMSYLHFTACKDYRRRVIQLGEAPERVFDVGALGVENLLRVPPMTLAELEESLNFQLEGKPFSVVTFHPVTLEDGTTEAQLKELISSMDAFPGMNYIITLANADAGGRTVNQLWQKEAFGRKNWLVVPSLGARRYLSALRHAAMVLGNSSSGIVEAPAAHIPTVNVGDRQKGRMMAESIICCPPVREEITAAMERALSPEFQAVARRASCPFGDGNTSGMIMEVLRRFLDAPEKNMKKSFYDIPFEV